MSDFKGRKDNEINIKSIIEKNKSLEAKLALSEKKLGVAVDFIEAVHDYDQEFISDYCLEKIKEIEEME